MDGSATAIHLEIRLDSGLPVGRAYDARGGVREFAGWISLVATIEHLLAATPSPSAPPTSQERHGP